MQCFLPERSPPFKTYVQALASAVGDPKIMEASGHYGKGIFYLAKDATMQDTVEEGLIVGGKHVFLEHLKELGTRVALNPVPLYLTGPSCLSFKVWGEFSAQLPPSCWVGC